MVIQVVGWGLYLYQLERGDDEVQAKLQADPTAFDQCHHQHTSQAADGENEDIEPRAKRRRGPSWQMIATVFWRTPSLVAPTRHLRRRLDGFSPHLRCLEGHRVQRALTVLARSRHLVAPRVQAAYIRIICDGWSTHVRYQCRGACRFGRRHGIDSVVHFAQCPVANSWGLRVAQLQRAPIGLELDFFLCMASEAFFPHSSRQITFLDRGCCACMPYTRRTTQCVIIV